MSSPGILPFRLANGGRHKAHLLLENSTSQTCTPGGRNQEPNTHWAKRSKNPQQHRYCLLPPKATPKCKYRQGPRRRTVYWPSSKRGRPSRYSFPTMFQHSNSQLFPPLLYDFNDRYCKAKLNCLKQPKACRETRTSPGGNLSRDRCLDRLGLLKSKFPRDTLKEIPFAEHQLPSTQPDNERHRIKGHLKTNEGWAAAQ